MRVHPGQRNPGTIIPEMMKVGLHCGDSARKLPRRLPSQDEPITPRVLPGSSPRAGLLWWLSTGHHRDRAHSSRRQEQTHREGPSRVAGGTNVDSSQTRPELSSRLAAAGFDFADPDPLAAWRVFKDFALEPVDCADDASRTSRVWRSSSCRWSSVPPSPPSFCTRRSEGGRNVSLPRCPIRRPSSPRILTACAGR
jgi:hypothetical protein